MTKIKNIWFASIALASSVQQIFAANWESIDFWNERVEWKIQGTGASADSAIQDIVSNLLKFIWIVAVLYGIYGGFLILTAWWKDDNVKKWKTILVQSFIWIVVIFLAYSIVNWILTMIVWTDNGPV